MLSIQTFIAAHQKTVEKKRFSHSLPVQRTDIITNTKKWSDASFIVLALFWTVFNWRLLIERRCWLLKACTHWQQCQTSLWKHNPSKINRCQGLCFVSVSCFILIVLSLFSLRVPRWLPVLAPVCFTCVLLPLPSCAWVYNQCSPVCQCQIVSYS